MNFVLRSTGGYKYNTIPKETLTLSGDRWCDAHDFVEINTLEELIELIEKAGKEYKSKYKGDISGVVIRKDFMFTREWCLEIYDDYRE